MTEIILQIINGIVSIVLLVLLRLEKNKTKKMSNPPKLHPDCDTCPYRKQIERLTDEFTGEITRRFKLDAETSKKQSGQLPDKGDK